MSGNEKLKLEWFGIKLDLTGESKDVEDAFRAMYVPLAKQILTYEYEHPDQIALWRANPQPGLWFSFMLWMLLCAERPLDVERDAGIFAEYAAQMAKAAGSKKGGGSSGRPVIEKSDAILEMLKSGIQWPDIFKVFGVKGVDARLALQKKVRDRRAYLARRQRAKHKSRPSSTASTNAPGEV